MHHSSVTGTRQKLSPSKNTADKVLHDFCIKNCFEDIYITKYEENWTASNFTTTFLVNSLSHSAK